MADNEPKKEIRQASNIIAICSIIGLTVCFGLSLIYNESVPLFLYAIFGGGILGTNNVLEVLRSIFRIGNGK